jgi:hypothetical protein
MKNGSPIVVFLSLPLCAVLKVINELGRVKRLNKYLDRKCRSLNCVFRLSLAINGIERSAPGFPRVGRGTRPVIIGRGRHTALCLKRVYLQRKARVITSAAYALKSCKQF